MSNDKTFEQTIEDLLALADREEQSIQEDTEIDPSEKQVFKILLQGYRKALNDLQESSRNDATN